MNIAVKLSLAIHLALLLTYGYGQTTAPDSTENDPINYAEVMPEFRSGTPQTWVKRHLLYPPEAFEAGIEGKVFTTFTIETDGSVHDIKTRRSTDTIFEQAAVEVVRNMPLWKPAKFKGKTTQCTYWLPITFKLDEAILRVADEMPSFPEGDVQDWMKKKMPDTLSLQSLASPTLITFIIEKDGCVSSPEILRSCGNSVADTIAIRIVGDMPSWKPAKHRGVPVRILYTLAVNVSSARQ